MSRNIENKFAVVGLGGIFPDAGDLNQYWNNIINKKVSIDRLPDAVLDRETHYRPECIGKTYKSDKTYTDLTARVKSFDFDPRKFRITPLAAKHMDDNQKVSLLSVNQAIQTGVLDSVNNEKISVIMGNTLVGDLHTIFTSRFCFDRFANHIQKNHIFNKTLSDTDKNAIIEEVRAKVLNNSFGVTEDSAPGILPNIIAARICSVFDFHGNSFIIDAACASALASIICGIHQLKTNESDAVICGAVDMLHHANGLIYFSGINALSPDGSFPFDARANGFVVGQGGGVIILKRLSDALKSNDKIYALITGYGQSSDGKGRSIAAPNEIWQAATIEKAYRMAGYHIDTVEYIEAHGTSTQVGDASEISALKKSFKELGVTRNNYCGISSVKSNIGHLKSAAGIAGLLKAILAINNKVLPPTANFQKLNPNLHLDDSPFYILSETKKWIEKEHPRRAGVSAFGFGGADYHIALEEFREIDYQNRARQYFESADLNTSPLRSESVVQRIVSSYQKIQTIALFSSNTQDALFKNLEDFSNKTFATENDFYNELYLNNCTADAAHSIRLAITIDSHEKFLEKTAFIKKFKNDFSTLKAISNKGIFWNNASPITRNQLAFLFPGQGSQYPDMLLDISNSYSSSNALFSQADALWKKMNGYTVTELIDSSATGKETTENILRDTRNTHPAIFVSSLALYNILKVMNVIPAFMIGHSLGEITALTAAGKISLREALNVINSRSKSFKEISSENAGAMVALKLNKFDTNTCINQLGNNLYIANVNSSAQTIVSGSVKDINLLLNHCNKEHIQATRLNVSHAFHSPLMQPAEDYFKKCLDKISFSESTINVISNEYNTFYENTPEDIIRKLSTQITGTVNFEDSIRKLYNDGVRIFVEIGPGNILSNLTGKILNGEDVTILTSNFKNSDPIESFNKMLCGLFTTGINIDVLPPVVTNTNSLSNNIITTPVPCIQMPSRESLDIPKIVYSGVSAGLPGSFKKSFRDDNFQQLFDGRNQIERLTDEEKSKLVDLNISKLVKSENGANYAILDSVNQVIQLAGKIGQIDMLKDYHISEKDLNVMGSAISNAVAAGYEALRDAQIPLIHEYSKTSSGNLLPDKWALPQEMQHETGIIFANALPMIDTVISEVSRHISYKLSSKIKTEIFDFYDSLIGNVSDIESKKLLADWFALNYSRLSLKPARSDIYTFNHHFMTQIALQANNLLAKFINARGPNFQLSAACSSTASAITVAEEFIRNGRVKRMIVIAADDACSEMTLPYIGAAFLSTGACSNEPDLYEAAVPFDKRRNGMIMGAGSVGIILEAESECRKRGVIPVCELMGTHCFNTAGHHSQLDVFRYAEELESFISKMESKHNINRSFIADHLMYFSHETYTPARGGCAESEAVSLRHVFGDDFRKIEISNTKGMTGHTMGASIEDATAAKSLQYAKIPPVVNFKYPDLSLDGLKLSKGGEHVCTYALRMAAGFGSQGNYILLRKIADKDNRIEQQNRYHKWLQSVSGLEKPEIQYLGRTLVVKDALQGAVIVNRPKMNDSSRFISQSENKKNMPQSTMILSERTADSAYSGSSVSEKSVSVEECETFVYSIISEVTGYSVDMLDQDMEIEADLGVDTVKQATILSKLADKFGISNDSGFRISDFTTIKSIVNFFSNNAGSVTSNSSFPNAQSTSEKNLQFNNSNEQSHKINTQSDKILFQEHIFKVISDVTGYSVDMLDPDMEIEADLGVDTVKQATILARLGELYGIESDKGFKISEFPTIGKIVEYFVNCNLNSNISNVSPHNSLSSAVNEDVKVDQSIELKKIVFDVISEVTGYAIDMLDQDMEIEADLGVDTVKQATILSKLSEKFNLNNEMNFRLSEYPTIKHIIQLFKGHQPVMSNVLSENSTVTIHEKYKSNLNDGCDAVPEGSGNVPATCVNTIKLIFTQVTQYPPEMIEMDLSLRDDLGLSSDAVKKLEKEIITEFDLDSDWIIPDDALIGDIVTSVENKCKKEKDIPEDIKKPIQLARQILVLKPLPLDLKRHPITEKTVWIIGNDSEYVNKIKTVFQSKVRFTGCFIFPDKNIENYVMQIVKNDFIKNPPEIIIDTTSCGLNNILTDMAFECASKEIDRASESRFLFYKYMQEQNIRPERILAVISVDGSFGIFKNTHIKIDPLSGLYDGFYKSLRKEWPDTFISIFDENDSCRPASDSFLNKIIVDEIETKSSGVDVCYQEGVRSIVVVEDRPCFPEDFSSNQFNTFDFTDVVVVTGGGTGITSKVILRLSKYFPSNYILLGRTMLVDNVDAYAKMSSEELLYQKTIIEKRLRSTNAHIKPVQIEAEYNKIVKSIEIYNTLQQLKINGCKSKYFSVDIRDFYKLEDVFAEIRRTFGPVTALIHGAGVEISHMIDKKSLEEFHHIQSIKTYGAYNLSVLCKNDPVKSVVAFSSISGLLGNAAQLDYSAANSFLNFWSRMYSNQSIHARSLIWSGWKNTGMAWRNTFVKEYSESLGINLLNPDEAAIAAVREIYCPHENTDIVIHNGLGSLTDSEMSSQDLTQFPLIDRLEYDKTGLIAIHRRISLSRDEIINQHRLGTTPLMPGVGFMEIMAETFSLLSKKNHESITFKNLEFTGTLKLYHNKSRDIKIEISKIDDSSYKMVAVGSQNNDLNISRQFCSAVVSPGKTPPALDISSWDFGKVQQVSLRSLMDRNKDFSNNVDFGPIFNDVKLESSPDCMVNFGENGLYMKVNFPQAQLINHKYPLEKYQVNPAFLDTMHQAGGFCSILLQDNMYLPFGAEEFTIFKTPNINTHYHTYAIVQEKTDKKIAYDIALLDSSGHLFCYAKNSAFHWINQ